MVNPWTTRAYVLAIKKKRPKNIYELGKFLVKLIQQVYELLNVNQLADKKSIQI